MAFASGTTVGIHGEEHLVVEVHGYKSRVYRVGVHKTCMGLTDFMVCRVTGFWLCEV